MSAGGAVVVTGATGTVGRDVVVELAGRGAMVRVATRHRAVAGTGISVEGVRFSFTDPQTWAAAFAGARAVFVVRPPQLGNVARDLLPALAAARAGGVGRVVFLSVLGAEHNPLLPHRRVERWLETSGMAATQLRVGNFMQNLTGVHAADIRDLDRLVLPAGAAALSYVDTRDVAAAAARCLLEEVPTRGAWDLTGPEAITHTQIAAALSDVLNRPIRYSPTSLPRYWVHARRTGMRGGVTAATSVLYTLARVGVGSRVSGDLAQLLGRRPGDIHHFARDHRATWTR